MKTLEENIFEFGEFRLDAANKVLRRGGEIVPLPLKAVELLCVLIEKRGEIVAKAEILDAVWKDSFVEESVLTQNIYTLRRTFEELGATNLIKTVPRRGYIFNYEKNAAASITIEREIYEEIEIVETALPNNISALPPAVQIASKAKFFSIAAVLLLLGSAIFSYWWWNKRPAKATVSDIKAIAVLPFKSFDKESSDDDLRLRLTDALTTKLGKIETLSVRPTSSTMKFLNGGEDSLEIGRQLSVDAILEGSVQREADKIRVTLQLVSVKNGEQIWAEQFDGEAGKLLDLQNAVSAKLLDKLNLPLSNEQQTEFTKRPTNNFEAYEEYLKGRYFWNKRTAESLHSAIAAFEKAAEIDPNFADAYIGLADSYYLLFDYSYDTSPENVETARRNIGKAMALNPNSPEALSTLGLIQTTFDWNWKTAEESLRKAIRLAPNSPNAHHRYGTLLGRLRRFDEAVAEMKTAKRLDPTSSAINMNLGKILMYAKLYDDAAAQLNFALKLEPAFTAPRWYLARCYWFKGDRKQGVREWTKAVEADGDKDLADKVSQILNSSGENAAIRTLAAEWEKRISPTGINDHDLAILNAFLGNQQETLNWLEKSVAAHHPWATWINVEPEFDFIRDEPRFQEILRSLNFTNS